MSAEVEILPLEHRVRRFMESCAQDLEDRRDQLKVQKALMESLPYGEKWKHAQAMASHIESEVFLLEILEQRARVWGLPFSIKEAGK